MKFKDRKEAGKLLCKKLKKYKTHETVVYAIPRGGIVTAFEIAKYLNVPLGLVITRKISHPSNPEYAIAAIAGNGHIMAKEKALKVFDKKRLAEEIDRQKQEVERRRKEYMKEAYTVSPHDKTAIIVDDGVATGLTMLVAIMEVKHKNPKKIVVATPVITRSTANLIEDKVSELVALSIPSDDKFLGAVGAHYEDFSEIKDEEVVKILKMWNSDTKLTQAEKQN